MPNLLKENQILLAVTVTLALYDFFTLPYNSFLITCVFAIALYFITKSTFIVAFIFFIPQIIHISNILLGYNEGMENSPKEINTLIKSMVNKHSSGKSVNENFTDANEISQRNIDIRNKNALNKVYEISGVVDDSIEGGPYPIEGNPSYPNFMREEFMGANINTDNRIETVPEEDVPVNGTVDNKPRPNNVVESYDDESLNTALSKNNVSNSSLSNLKSVNMTM